MLHRQNIENELIINVLIFFIQYVRPREYSGKFNILHVVELIIIRFDQSQINV